MIGPEAVSAPLIGHTKDSCIECWSCVRVCPVRAIRVVGGRSEVVREKCVACGLCVGECGQGGHVVRDDRPAVRELLRSRRPVVALLAGEFVPALHPMTVSQIERALEVLGFLAVETTLLGEEIVAEAYEKLHQRGDSLLSMRSTCPVAVDFVRKYYPALVSALAPIVPPYVAQARLIREAYELDVAVVYVSPCYARKDEFRDPQFEGAVDAVIDFLELKELIAEVGDAPVRGRAAMPVMARPSVLKEVSLTDGFPRQTLVSRDLTDGSVQVVRGLDDLDRLLRAMLDGEVGPAIIDMLNCEGCIDGPAVSPGLSLFAKRNLETAARQRPGATRVSTRAMLGVLPSVETVRSFAAEPVSTPMPTPAEIDEVLVGGRLTRESAPDCGACGWPTCVEQAVAVFRAESSWDLCLPLQRELASEQSSLLETRRLALDDARTLDEETGVWNRRAFAERLDVEMARFRRYGSPVSVAFVEVDGPGDNDVELLRAVATRIAGELRSTDFTARWGGARLALILPGISKTAAFAVAEKLRSAIAGMPFAVGTGGYTREVSATASLGVAAASVSAGDGHALVEAADVALHEAKGAGGDRVHLAPG